MLTKTHEHLSKDLTRN